MKDKIKEILEDYKKLAGEITLKLDNTAEYESWLIIQEYVDRFLDYITNLQEENERLVKDVDMWNKLYNKEFDKNKKALKYIKNNTYFKDNVVKTMIFKDFSNELSEILGDDNE